MPRKTKKMNKKGSGFSNTKRKVSESRSACYETIPMGNPHIYDKGLMNAINCQTFVHKFDVQAFPVKDISGRDVYKKYKIESNEFFKSPSFKSKVTSRNRRDGIDLFYDGKKFKNDRVKWYEEIGSRILWYNFPNPEVNKRGCYVLRDKPLTIEEVETNTNDQLNAMLSTLPCITDKTVNRWYRKGQRLYNPDYKPPVAPAPLAPTPMGIPLAPTPLGIPVAPKPMAPVAPKPMGAVAPKPMGAVAPTPMGPPVASKPMGPVPLRP